MPPVINLGKQELEREGSREGGSHSAVGGREGS